MSVANEFHTATLIDATDGCSVDTAPYWLPIGAKRLSIKRDNEYNIRLSLVYIFFQKSNLFWSMWRVIGKVPQKYCYGLTLSSQQQLAMFLKQLFYVTFIFMTVNIVRQ